MKLVLFFRFAWYVVLLRAQFKRQFLYACHLIFLQKDPVCRSKQLPCETINFNKCTFTINELLIKRIRREKWFLIRWFSPGFFYQRTEAWKFENLLKSITVSGHWQVTMTPYERVFEIVTTLARIFEPLSTVSQIYFKTSRFHTSLQTNY